MAPHVCQQHRSYLITAIASRQDLLSMMAAAVQLALLDKVNQIHKELVAFRANKALWMKVLIGQARTGD